VLLRYDWHGNTRQLTNEVKLSNEVERSCYWGGSLRIGTTWFRSRPGGSGLAPGGAELEPAPTNLQKRSFTWQWHGVCLSRWLPRYLVLRPASASQKTAIVLSS